MKLLVLWKSDSDIDIHNLIIPYTRNAKKHHWFDDVELLIWGKSQKRAVESTIQETLKTLMQEGISIYACKMCADDLDVTPSLEAIGVTVKYTGEFLTNRLKDSNCKVITL
ncbi:MAG: DsrE family protein [Candidatus Izimaplasma sp.]|nr:DsrE family protein [Candidatus Izimaplasma bacterium]